jgi:hypothetical protein
MDYQKRTRSPEPYVHVTLHQSFRCPHRTGGSQLLLHSTGVASGAVRAIRVNASITPSHWPPPPCSSASLRCLQGGVAAGKGKFLEPHASKGSWNYCLNIYSRMLGFGNSHSERYKYILKYLPHKLE